MKKVLYICSEFSAGMMPFAATIVNTMKSEETYGIFISKNENPYSSIIEPNKGHYYFLEYPRNKIKRFLHKICPWSLFQLIIKVCKENDIRNIHFLTQETILILFISVINRKYEIFFTVHDLNSHPIKYRNFIHYIESHIFFFIPIKIYILIFNNLITSSKNQYENLIKKYPHKKISWHPFPTLINKRIENGQEKINELKDIANYYLFFGRIEYYKGIDFLYNTYLNNTILHNRKLVIAGGGDIFFERNIYKENDNVIFINRFIKDEEVNWLFKNAAIVIYPYYSATQSGVVSFSFFYQKPFVVSKVPFFEEYVENNINAAMFSLENIEEFIECLKKFDNKSYLDKIQSNQSNIYEKYFSLERLKQSIKQIY